MHEERRGSKRAEMREKNGVSEKENETSEQELMER